MPSTSKLEYKIVVAFVRTASFLCVVNADWDSLNQRLKPRNMTQQPVKVLRFKIYICGTVFWTVYNVWRVCHITWATTTANEINPLLTTVFLYLLIAALGTCVCSVPYAVHQGHLVELFNQFLAFNDVIDVINTEYAGTRSSGGGRQKKFLYLQLLLCSSCSNMTLLIALAEAYFSWKLSSNLALSGFMAFVAYTVNFSACCALGFLQLYIFLFYTITKDIVQFKSHVLKSDSYSINKYRGLTILCDWLNEVYCRYMIPGLQYTFCFICMISVVITVRWQQLDPDGSVLIPISFFTIAVYLYVIILVTADLFSKFWYSSKEFLWQLENHKDNYTKEIRNDF